MARIVLGLGTSHSPQLSTPPEVWPVHAERDKRSDDLFARSKLAEGAKKEGKLVFYGTLGVDASRPFLELFRKSHPYISIDHYRSNEGGIYNKVATEATAGKHSVDVIESASLTASNLIDRGLVEPYNSPESAAIRTAFVDPKRLWHGYSYLPVALGYNKRYVKESELPKNYEDLLLSTWKGRLSLDKDDSDIFRVFLTLGAKSGLCSILR